jgi:(R,R)-butanediol dehydrogenase/meso-butanediol dehydrogenase/diacetyl reductase
VRAVTVTHEGRLTVAKVPDPVVGPDDVLVRVAACGICGSDLHMLEAGLFPVGSIPGHEASGIVEAVGSSVIGVGAGDHVAIQPFDPCGACGPCTSGATQRCVNNAFTTIGLGGRAGAFAELVTVSPQMAVPVPADLPVDLAALSEPLAVAYHGYRRSRFAPGTSVGVIGCGPIGLSAVALAKPLGAGRVWASDVNAFRAELATSLGADEAGTTPREADVVFDCAGAKGTVDLAVSSAAGGGQVVVLAVNISGDSVWPFVWVTKEVEIVPCLGYTIDEYTECAAMISSGRVDVSRMVTRRIGLDDTDDAFAALLEGTAEGKVLVTP